MGIVNAFIVYCLAVKKKLIKNTENHQQYNQNKASKYRPFSVKIISNISTSEIVANRIQLFPPDRIYMKENVH